MKRIIFLILLIPQVAIAGFVGYLKADTEVKVTIGPFVDVGDGFTPQTDIALSGDEAELLKHGSDTVVDISGATWAAVTNCRGYYTLTLTTSHTDTEGLITVIVQDDSDCLPVRCSFMVMNDNSFEAFFENAAEILTVNTTQVNGTAQTANDMSGDVDDILTDTGTTLDGIVDSIVEDTGTTLDTLIKAIPTNTEFALRTLEAADYTVVTDLGTVQTGDSFAIVNGAHGLVSIQDDVDEILTDTGTTLDTIVDSILADTGTDGVIVGAVNADAIEAGDFKTGAIDADALATDAVTEFWSKAMEDIAAGAPDYNATVFKAINYLYEAWRNGYKTDGTNDEIVLYKDDGTTPLVEATIADDGTDFTREEYRAPD